MTKPEMSRADTSALDEILSPENFPPCDALLGRAASELRTLRDEYARLIRVRSESKALLNLLQVKITEHGVAYMSRAEMHVHLGDLLCAVEASELGSVPCAPPGPAPLFRIKCEMTGTYFVGMSGIGPRFGGTREQAATFTDGMEAYRTMSRFPMVVLADMVNEDDVPCTVDGKARTR